jgi:hypothetical protein
MDGLTLGLINVLIIDGYWKGSLSVSFNKLEAAVCYPTHTIISLCFCPLVSMENVPKKL